MSGRIGRFIGDIVGISTLEPNKSGAKGVWDITHLYEYKRKNSWTDIVLEHHQSLTVTPRGFYSVPTPMGRYEVFLASDNFTVTAGTGYVEYLIIGGGGAGGGGNMTQYQPGGGGGAGGFVTGVIRVTPGTYPVVIGAGGAGGPGTNPSGSNSSVFGITAYGGGAGRAVVNGIPGASGGGTGVPYNALPLLKGGQADTYPKSVATKQGNPGGSSVFAFDYTTPNVIAAGGGGAGSAGVQFTTYGYYGGEGLEGFPTPNNNLYENVWTYVFNNTGQKFGDIGGGTPLFATGKVYFSGGGGGGWGGGGGGGGYGTGTGGWGGGGRGAYFTSPAFPPFILSNAGNGGSNSGGGGGGGVGDPTFPLAGPQAQVQISYGGSGGSGVVILRFKS